MTLQEQVVSLELAKKLKELGVKQESLFYWINRQREHEGLGEWYYTECEYKLVDIEYIRRYLREEYIASDMIEKQKGTRIYSAFTVAELWNILPHCIRQDYYLEFVKKQPYNLVTYRKYQSNYIIGDIQGPKDNPAEALGRMLIYLIENNLITVTVSY